MKTRIGQDLQMVSIKDITGEHYDGPVLVKLACAPSNMDYMRASFGLITAYAVLIFYADGDTREWPINHPLMQDFEFHVLPTGSTITMEQA